MLFIEYEAVVYYEWALQSHTINHLFYLHQENLLGG
jgi:hypothetical protein